MQEEFFPFLEEEKNCSDEIICLIIQYLDLKSLSSMARVNKKAFSLIQTKYLQPFKILAEHLEELGYHLDFESLLPHLMNSDLDELIDLVMRVEQVFDYQKKFVNNKLSTEPLEALLMLEHKQLLNIQFPPGLSESSDDSILEKTINNFIGTYVNDRINPILLLNWILLRMKSYQKDAAEELSNQRELFENILLSYLAFRMNNNNSISALALMYENHHLLMEVNGTEINWTDHSRDMQGQVVFLLFHCLENWLQKIFFYKKEEAQNIVYYHINEFEEILAAFIPSRYHKSIANFKLLTKEYGIEETFHYNTYSLISSNLPELYFKVYSIEELSKYFNEEDELGFDFYCRAWLSNCTRLQVEEIATILKTCVSTTGEVLKLILKVDFSNQNFDAIKSIISAAVSIYSQTFLSPANHAIYLDPTITLTLIINFFLAENNFSIAEEKMTVFCQQMKKFLGNEERSYNRSMLNWLTSVLYTTDSKNIPLVLQKFYTLDELVDLFRPPSCLNNQKALCVYNLFLVGVEFTTSLFETHHDNLIPKLLESRIVEMMTVAGAEVCESLLKLGTYQKLSQLTLEHFIILARMSNLENNSINSTIKALINSSEEWQIYDSLLTYLKVYSDNNLKKFSLLLLVYGLKSFKQLYNTPIYINDKETNILSSLFNAVEDYTLLYWIMKDCINELKLFGHLTQKTIAIIIFLGSCKQKEQAEKIKTVITRIGYKNLKNTFHIQLKFSGTFHPMWRVIINSFFTTNLLALFLKKFSHNYNFDYINARSLLQANVAFYLSLEKIFLSTFNKKNLYWDCMTSDLLEKIFNLSRSSEQFESLIIEIANYNSLYLTKYLINSLHSKMMVRVDISKLKDRFYRALAEDESLDKFLIKTCYSSSFNNLPINPDQPDQNVYEYLVNIIDQMHKTNVMHDNIITKFFDFFQSQQITVVIFLEFILQENKVCQEKIGLLLQSRLLEFFLYHKGDVRELLNSHENNLEILVSHYQASVKDLSSENANSTATLLTKFSGSIMNANTSNSSINQLSELNPNKRQHDNFEMAEDADSESILNKFRKI